MKQLVHKDAEERRRGLLKYASLCTSRAKGVDHFFVRTHYLNSSFFNVRSTCIPGKEDHFFALPIYHYIPSNLDLFFKLRIRSIFNQSLDLKFIREDTPATLSVFVNSVSTQLECKYMYQILARNRGCPKYSLISTSKNQNSTTAPFYESHV